MLDPFTAADLFHDGARILGPLIGTAASLKDLKNILKSELDADQGAALQEGVAFFFKEFTKEKQREIISILAKVTDVQTGDGFPALDSVFLPHFQGATGRLYKWLFFALQVQFADLSKGLENAIGKFGQYLQPE